MSDFPLRSLPPRPRPAAGTAELRPASAISRRPAAMLATAMLALGVLLVLGACGGGGKGGRTGGDDARPTTAQAPTWSELAEASYPLDEIEAGLRVKLHEGRWENEPRRIFINLVKEPIAQGDIDGDGSAEVAVTLGCNTGGSGVFVVLALMGTSEADTLVCRGTALLGDRVRPLSLQVEKGGVEVDMITHGPDDPMCCPTLRVRRSYEWKNGTLTLRSEG